MKIVLDPGSTHMGNKDDCFELIDTAKDVGADAIKFQLGVREPNIDVPLSWWPELVLRAESNEIEITASTFTDEAFNMMLEFRPVFMKFSYGEAQNKAANYHLSYIQKVLDAGIQCVVSTDIMNYKKFPDECIKLFCIPQYPVYWEISFDRIFPPFDGFSDHTLGYRQTLNAVLAGAKWIEKHFKLDNDADCPDATFALRPKDTRDMIRYLKAMDSFQVEEELH